MTASDPAVKESRLKLVDWNNTGNTASSGASMVVIYNPVRASATVDGGPLVLDNARAGGSIQVAVGPTGRVRLCSPGGSVTGVASCPT